MPGGPADAQRISDLVLRQQVGRVKFLAFWGHRPEPSGRIGTGCLSQWWSAAFDIDGVTYPSAEHYMMAAKARLFGDSAIEAKVLAARTPAEAKSLGRQIASFDEQVWLDRRFRIVVDGGFAKFSQNALLGAFLSGTADRVLVEASPLDRIWGIGLAAADPRVEQPDRWLGLNLLGFALMEVRDRLRA